MTASTVERRALGAVRFVDQTTGAMIGGLRLQSTGDWYTNRSGTWVLRGAPGLFSHTTTSEPPSEPKPGRDVLKSVVIDPTGRYLPRTFGLTVPRVVGHPQHDLLNVPSIPLPPSPAMPLLSRWASVRARVVLSGGGKPDVPVQGALLRLSRGNDTKCLSLTDARGEGLVIVAGIPLFSAGEDESAVLAPQIEHRVEVWVDVASTDPLTGAASSVPDPDDLWARRNGLKRRFRDLRLGSAEQETLTFTFSRS